jgi:effector-binding domain-containing protein
MNFKIRPVGSDASMLTVSLRLGFRQDSLLHYLRLMFDRSDELELIDCLESIDGLAVASPGSIDVHLQHVDGFSYISIKDSCSLAGVLQRMNDLHKELLVFGMQRGIELTARPFALYHRLSAEQAVFSMCIPVFEQVSVSGRVGYGTMQGRDHVVADYYGAYDTLEDGHNAIQQWLMRYRRRLTGQPWELYVTDPMAEVDPNKWLTRIFYPVN